MTYSATATIIKRTALDSILNINKKE